MFRGDFHVNRLSALVAGAAFCVSLAVQAQEAPKPIPPSMPMPSNFLYAKDVPVVPMAEWEIVQKGAAEQTGARILIAAGDAELVRAPKDAVRYDSQTFKIPTGSVRVLTFKKANGGVLHQITTETVLYVVKGSGEVGVNGVPTKIVAGDVVNLPNGVLRSIKKKAEDTTVLAFTVGYATPSKSVLVRGKDIKSTTMANGATQDANAAKTNLKRYTFEGNSVRIAGLTGRGKTTAATPRVDVLVYMLSGRMANTVGDETKTVSAGDVLREEAGKPTSWDVFEDSVFLAINAPLIVPPASK